MQRAFAEHNESAEEPIRVRIGLNAGEPIAEDEDLFGTAVNLAARICSQAEAGQILAPIVVRELAAGKRFLFADLGETELRGFEDPVRLYELRWREAGWRPLTPAQPRRRSSSIPQSCRGTREAAPPGGHRGRGGL